MLLFLIRVSPCLDSLSLCIHVYHHVEGIPTRRVIFKCCREVECLHPENGCCVVDEYFPDVCFNTMWTRHPKRVRIIWRYDCLSLEFKGSSSSNHVQRRWSVGKDHLHRRQCLKFKSLQGYLHNVQGKVKEAQNCGVNFKISRFSTNTNKHNFRKPGYHSQGKMSYHHLSWV